MKKASKLIAIILCVLMAFSMVIPAYAADNEDVLNPKKETEGTIISWILNTLVNDVLLGTIARLLPNLDFINEYKEEFDTENFYEGNDTFIPCDSDSYTWSVGYGSQSILPDDFGVKFKYARGSYAPWGYSTKVYKDDDGNDETMKVRTIVLDDNTGRGKAVICSVDCIGISNTDVKKIRAAMSQLAMENDIVSIDISSIHSHMAIDSQGVWGAPLTTVAQNFLSINGFCRTKNGVNQDYLNTIIERTKLSVEEALNDMKDGRLTYTNCELEGYMGARDVSHELDGDMHTLC
ncbi:MAG: hypothetical protein MJ177_01825, partial [Clostridia bacterium]|nr:hypothetical protein [Clostridia bacterium]